MATKFIQLEVDEAWTDEEIAIRAGRMAWPVISAEQSAKTARRVELESAELARLGAQVERLATALESLEQCSASRAELTQVADSLAGLSAEARDQLRTHAQSLADLATGVAETGRIVGERIDSIEANSQVSIARIRSAIGGTKTQLGACRRRIEALEDLHRED